MLCGTPSRTVSDLRLQKGGEGTATVSPHCNEHWLKAVLTFVSEQALKGTKIDHCYFFDFLGL